MKTYRDSELILNANRRVYHLDLNGEEIADRVILVGDPERVTKISRRFSKIESKRGRREFLTHTGWFEGQRLTVLSTGIGCDNIDIVLNEVDAAVNINLEKRQEQQKKRALHLVRLGTCGALQAELTLNSVIAASFAVGLDGVLHYYQALNRIDQRQIVEHFKSHTRWPNSLPEPYCVPASSPLPSHLPSGITITAPGFYAPQGRELRLQGNVNDLPELLNTFRFEGLKITNFEMETSALYGLGKLLGHSCLSLSVVIANRLRGEFSQDLETSEEILIDTGLQHLKTL